jgi:hypothetical protein
MRQGALQADTTRWQLTSALSVLLFLANISVFYPSQVFAQEMRIVDAHGLVRAVRATKGVAGRIVVTLDLLDKPPPKGECVANNVDGLASEKRVSVSAVKGECVFMDVAPGSWQITVPEGFTWRVRLEF